MAEEDVRENRELFLDFCRTNEVHVMNTYFEKPPERQCTRKELGTELFEAEEKLDRIYHNYHQAWGQYANPHYSSETDRSKVVKWDELGDSSAWSGAASTRCVCRAFGQLTAQFGVISTRSSWPVTTSANTRAPRPDR